MAFRPRVLLIDDAAELRALMHLLLTGLGCEPVVAADAGEACEQIRIGAFDVVLLDVFLGDEAVARVVDRIREAGHRGRLLTVSAGPAPDQVASNGHLSKPMTRDKLASAVREGLPADVWSVPLPVSRLQNDREFRPLLNQFVVVLDHRAREIEHLFGANDARSLRRLLHTIEGSAGSYGFDEITREARDVGERLKDGAALGDVAPAVTRLRKLCSRARAASG